MRSKLCCRLGWVVGRWSRPSFRQCSENTSSKALPTKARHWIVSVETGELEPYAEPQVSSSLDWAFPSQRHHFVYSRLGLSFTASPFRLLSTWPFLHSVTISSSLDWASESAVHCLARSQSLYWHGRGFFSYFLFFTGINKLRCLPTKNGAQYLRDR